MLCKGKFNLDAQLRELSRRRLSRWLQDLQEVHQVLVPRCIYAGLVEYITSYAIHLFGDALEKKGLFCWLWGPWNNQWTLPSFAVIQNESGTTDKTTYPQTRAAVWSDPSQAVIFCKGSTRQTCGWTAGRQSVRRAQGSGSSLSIIESIKFCP